MLISNYTKLVKNGCRVVKRKTINSDALEEFLDNLVRLEPLHFDFAIGNESITES